MNPKLELIRLLEERGLNEMAVRAKAGQYSDFASDHPTPVTELVKELREAGANDLALRAINGDFDHDR